MSECLIFRSPCPLLNAKRETWAGHTTQQIQCGTRDGRTHAEYLYIPQIYRLYFIILYNISYTYLSMVSKHTHTYIYTYIHIYTYIYILYLSIYICAEYDIIYGLRAHQAGWSLDQLHPQVCLAMFSQLDCWQFHKGLHRGEDDFSLSFARAGRMTTKATPVCCSRAN